MNNRKLGRDSGHRQALLRTMATDLIIKGKMETTEKKAKELSSVVDKLITKAKRNDLANRREVASYIRNVVTADGKTALQVLFDEVAPKYKDRKGGYTRVTKTNTRKGDGAPLAIIELI